MRHTFTIFSVLSSRVALALLLAVTTAGTPTAEAGPPAVSSTRDLHVADGFTSGCRWRGTVKQGSKTFGLDFTVSERTGDRFTGRLRLDFNDGRVGFLKIQGAIDGKKIDWVTDRISGDVTYPGYYNGDLDNGSISGIWRVPTWNQCDEFCADLIFSPPRTRSSAPHVSSPSESATDRIARRKREILTDLGTPTALLPLPQLKNPGGIDGAAK